MRLIFLLASFVIYCYCKEWLTDCSTPDELEKIERTVLEWHNKFRKRHGAPPLNKSIILTNMALDWAKVLAEEQKLYRRPDIFYGQNMYESNDEVFDPKTAVQGWYHGESKFNYSKLEFDKSNYYFPQIIWKDTRMMGVGYAQVKKNKKSGKPSHFLVVHYHPAAWKGNATLNIQKPEED